MHNPFKKLPIRPVSKHIIVDGYNWVVDREYCELGVRQGWLVNHRMIPQSDGSFIYYYLYPDSETTE